MLIPFRTMSSLCSRLHQKVSLRVGIFFPLFVAQRSIFCAFRIDEKPRRMLYLGVL